VAPEKFLSKLKRISLENVFVDRAFGQPKLPSFWCWGIERFGPTLMRFDVAFKPGIAFRPDRLHLGIQPEDLLVNV
jgi:hypothetical protein